jgi:hypothetical protein
VFKRGAKKPFDDEETSKIAFGCGVEVPIPTLSVCAFAKNEPVARRTVKAALLADRKLKVM